MSDKKALILLLAGLLDYPDEDFLAQWRVFDRTVAHYLSDKSIQQDVLKKLKPLLTLTELELRELYVETFDYKETSGLYLTSQELGDSRTRGDALIKLQKLIEKAGYEHNGEELADYIPMLLELVAVTPDVEEIMMLQRRLAYAIHRIGQSLPKENPYSAVFKLLLTYNFKAPSKAEIAELERGREEADHEELPYPMLYM